MFRPVIFAESCYIPSCFHFYVCVLLSVRDVLREALNEKSRQGMEEQREADQELQVRFLATAGRYVKAMRHSLELYFALFT